MSADGKDADKSFLSRWSQRKREAKLPDANVITEQAETEAKAAPAEIAESEQEEEFDLSSLPKLEEITEGTDITGFMRKGVPESLRNAALRKSWALDPAIRNYVNPALDYAYDWNTPGGVPGNSELGAGMDVAKMVLQIMGSNSADTALQEAEAQPPGDAAGVDREIASLEVPQNLQPDLPPESVRLSLPVTDPVPGPAENHRSDQISAQNVSGMPEDTSAPQQQVRRHGTAKPRT